MQSIQRTVIEALPSNVSNSYGSYINTVVEALKAREAEAVEVLREGARRLGARESQVEVLLLEAGLIEPEPTPEPEPEEPQSVEAMIASLGEKIDALGARLDSAATQASRHGIRF